MPINLTGVTHHSRATDRIAVIADRNRVPRIIHHEAIRVTGRVIQRHVAPAADRATRHQSLTLHEAPVQNRPAAKVVVEVLQTETKTR